MRAPGTPVGRLRHHLHHLHHPLRAGGGDDGSASLAVTRHEPPRGGGAGGAGGAGPRRPAARRAVSATPFHREGGARGGAGGADRSPLLRRTKPTPGSTGFGSHAPSTQPAVVFAPRDTSPSYLAPVAGAVLGPWLRPWFQTDPRSRSSRRSPARGRVECDHGNNCWRCLGVFWFCF